MSDQFQKRLKFIKDKNMTTLHCLSAIGHHIINQTDVRDTDDVDARVTTLLIPLLVMTRSMSYETTLTILDDIAASLEKALSGEAHEVQVWSQQCEYPGGTIMVTAIGDGVDNVEQRMAALDAAREQAVEAPEASEVFDGSIKRKSQDEPSQN